MAKSFKGNPALDFISPSQAENVTNETTAKDVVTKDVVTSTANKDDVPKGYKINHDIVETKSKRVQCLLQPSVVNKLKNMASSKGVSMNEAINEAVRRYVEV